MKTITNHQIANLVVIFALLSIGLTLLVPTVGATSLFKESSEVASLFVDKRASKTGDILTIQIIEISSAEEKTSVSNDKKTSAKGAINSFFNLGSDIFGNDASGNTDFPSVDYSADKDFEGSGTISRSGSVRGTIAVVIKEILPSGNFLVEGKRSILIDDEKKNIVFSGLVRPYDISPNNTVLSTVVADAQITYEGFGSVSAAGKPGFFSKLLDWIPLW